MEYVKLGNSELVVSRFCLGCMSFGDASKWIHPWVLDEERSGHIIKHALDMGINFFDTANGYSAGTSEEYPGKDVKRYVRRDKVVLASKVYFNDGHLKKEVINREIEGTLKRFGAHPAVTDQPFSSASIPRENSLC